MVKEGENKCLCAYYNFFGSFFLFYSTISCLWLCYTADTKPKGLLNYWSICGCYWHAVIATFWARDVISLQLADVIPASLSIFINCWVCVLIFGINPCVVLLYCATLLRRSLCALCIKLWRLVNTAHDQMTKPLAPHGRRLTFAVGRKTIDCDVLCLGPAEYLST